MTSTIGTGSVSLVVPKSTCRQLSFARLRSGS
jgi:hypothetical protein